MSPGSVNKPMKNLELKGSKLSCGKDGGNMFLRNVG
jgi:hypothetical protein